MAQLEPNKNYNTSSYIRKTPNMNNAMNQSIFFTNKKYKRKVQKNPPLKLKIQ